MAFSPRVEVYSRTQILLEQSRFSSTEHELGGSSATPHVMSSALLTHILNDGICTFGVHKMKVLGPLERLCGLHCVGPLLRPCWIMIGYVWIF